MSTKAKVAMFIAILLWASAFVGIRMGLHSFSPEGLALFRYLIASFCMCLIYFRKTDKHRSLPFRDIGSLMLVGVLGIGIYNITLNYGELAISSGMSSFIISQSPILTAIIAIFFLNEPLTPRRALGFTISIIGVIFITLGEKGGFYLDHSMIYILIATLASSCYTLLQKPLLKNCHAIQATTYIIWGGTLFLAFYFPQLRTDLHHAAIKDILAVAYLGIFPGAIGYVAWSYALAEIPASRAASFLYFMPILATLLGWICLNEVPAFLSIVGGLIAMVGVWLVNHSYQRKQPILATAET